MAREQPPATVYVRKGQFTVGAPVQFDEKYPYLTALEYLLGALAGDVVTGFLSRAKKRRVKVDAIEARVSGQLHDPLTYLDVVGASGQAGLKRARMTVYVSTLGSEDEVQKIWEETLRTSPIVNTLKSTVELDLVWQLVV